MHPLPPFPWIDVVIILALVVLNGLRLLSDPICDVSRPAAPDIASRSTRPRQPPLCKRCDQDLQRAKSACCVSCRV